MSIQRHFLSPFPLVTCAATAAWFYGFAGDPNIASYASPGTNPQVTYELQRELREFVAKRQACTSTAQCTLVRSGCPFGCYWPVASSSASAVRAKLHEVSEKNRREGGDLCSYMCRPFVAVECDRGRCATVTPYRGRVGMLIRQRLLGWLSNRAPE